jgi:hypothetical protein
MTAQGWRTTASTLLNESGKWNPDAIERSLAHADSNLVRGIYNRGRYWDGDYAENAGFEEWNTQKAGTLVGVKFEDLNGNGVRDGGEPGVQGVTIFIDTDKDGVLDADERSTVTDANGNYKFFGVSLGTHQIDEVVPAGSTQTTGAFETVTIASTGQIVTVDPIGNFIPRPNYTVTKTATSITGGEGLNGLGGANSAGDIVNYSIVVANTGNVAITGYAISDPNAVLGSRTGDTNTNNILDAGETWTYSATHVVTQPELDSNGTANTGALDTDGDTDNRVFITTTNAGNKSADAVTLVITNPLIDVVKTAGARTDGDGNGDDAGDSQLFNFTVTNTGNISLLNVTLVDDNGTADDLAVGASTTGSLSHAFNQAQVDAGSYINTGKATGTGTNGAMVMDTDPETVSLVASLTGYTIR